MTAIFLKGNDMPLLNEDQRKEFEQLARPLMKFLNDSCHPHVIVIVEPTCAQLLEGKCSTGQIMDYVKD